jgi:hypothetical protein
MEERRVPAANYIGRNRTRREAPGRGHDPQTRSETDSSQSGERGEEGEFGQKASAAGAAGTTLICVSLSLVAETPLQLRRQAEHCRHLAKSQFDDRLRLILNTMADEFDRQACDNAVEHNHTNTLL